MMGAILAGLAIGVIVGIALVVWAANRVERHDEDRRSWYFPEYEPQRDELLDRILDEIRDADPRQTARDSATSARSKVFRG